MTRAAWDSLGVAATERQLPPDLEHRNAYVRLYLKKCSQPGALGAIADQLLNVDPSLYKVPVGHEQRAVMWHDAEGQVLWLVGGFSFPEDATHRKLYAAVQRAFQQGGLLPTDDEIRLGRAERFWFGVVDALAFALRRAEQVPYEWFVAEVEDAGGGTLAYGRFYVETEDIDDETMIVRYFVVLRYPPSGVPHPPGWQRVMFAELFPEGGPIEPVGRYELPEQANLDHSREIIVRHEIEVPNEHVPAADDALDQ